jgi:hypothetical protein
MDTSRIGSLFVLLGFLALTSVGLLASGPHTAKRALTGTLVDVTCATDPKRNLARLRSEHTRRCLQMPVCAENGYALLTDHGEVLKFNAKGDELARKLIENHPHTQSWRVSIEGTVQEDQLAVERIRLF